MPIIKYILSSFFLLFFCFVLFVLLLFVCLLFCLFVVVFVLPVQIMNAILLLIPICVIVLLSLSGR